MYFLKTIKNLIGQSLWIPIATLSFGILLLKVSDFAAVVKLIRWTMPSLSYYFIENLMVSGGLLFLLGSFGMFGIWLSVFNRKRLAKRKFVMQNAAAAMEWNYDEFQKSGLTPHLNNYKQCRILGIEPNSFCASLNISNVLSQIIGDKLFIVFDSELTQTSNNQDKGSFIFAETVYLVVSDRLNLPYFQTQPVSWFSSNVVTDFLENSVGKKDFSHRPDFFKKYILDGSDRQSVGRMFTTPVFGFYEQHQIYRTIADGKMLCLLQLQNEFIDQFQIKTQLQTLHEFYQLLTDNHI